MKFDFDNIPNRKNTNSVKYDEYPYSLPMWVADMDFYIAPKIKEAIRKDLEVGAIGYSLLPKEYFLAFHSFYKNRFDVDFSINDMVYSSGVVAAIDSSLKCLFKKGNKVVMLTPIYHTFFSAIKNSGLEVLSCPLKENNDEYSIDFLLLEELFKKEDTKVFLLCNPHNPIGYIFKKEELRKISLLADKYNVFVISDEIHGPISYKTKYHPYALEAVNDNFMTCLATSKAFNLAGLQSACIVVKNKKIRDQLQEAFYHDDIGEPNYFAVSANIAALIESGDWLDEMNEYVEKNKQFLYSFIDKELPMISYTVSEATYMVWLNISKISTDSLSFNKELGEKVGLYTSPGKQFGEGGEGHLRINLATSLANVKDALNRLKRFIMGE